MNFLEKIQEDLKKNLKEGLDIFKEGSSVLTDKLEQLTTGGKNKYKVFNLNMKVQEEFARLGGEVYDLIVKKSKNPLGSKSVTSIISKINKLEAQINKLEGTEEKKPVKKAVKKTAAKAKRKTTGKTAAKKTTTAKGKTASKSTRKTVKKTKTTAPKETDKS